MPQHKKLFFGHDHVVMAKETCLSAKEACISVKEASISLKEVEHVVACKRPVCCSVLQCVAVCCSVLQCVAVCCSVLQCVAVCCNVLQCVAVCCSVLKCDSKKIIPNQHKQDQTKRRIISLTVVYLYHSLQTST